MPRRPQWRWRWKLSFLVTACAVGTAFLPARAAHDRIQNAPLILERIAVAPFPVAARTGQRAWSAADRLLSEAARTADRFWTTVDRRSAAAVAATGSVVRTAVLAPVAGAAAGENFVIAFSSGKDIAARFAAGVRAELVGGDGLASDPTVDAILRDAADLPWRVVLRWPIERSQAFERFAARQVAATAEAIAGGILAAGAPDATLEAILDDAARVPLLLPETLLTSLLRDAGAGLDDLAAAVALISQPGALSEIWRGPRVIRQPPP